MTGDQPERPDKTLVLELFTMEEAAGRLRVSRRWLQDFLKTNPFYRMAGRKKLFTAADIKALYEAMPQPEGARTTFRPTPSPSEASLWAKAHAYREKDRNRKAKVRHTPRAPRGPGSSS